MAILATEKVLTHDYWKMAADVQVGDVLFDRLGNPVTVKLVQQYRAHRCFEVEFSDRLTVAGDEHLKLPLENEKYRNRANEYKGRFQFKRPLKPTPLGNLIDTPLKGRPMRREFSVPTTGGLKLPAQDLPVPPFVFGFWFFNHNKYNKFKPAPQYAEFVTEKLKDSGYIPEKGAVFDTKPTVISHLIPNVPHKIPNNYLLSSAEQRFELLSGILHARPKRYNPKVDTIRFTSKNKIIASQIQYLAESLGCKTKMTFDETKRYFTVFIKTRLKLLQDQTPKPIKVRQAWRYVADVYEIQPQACVHIETDGEDNTFLVGEGFIPCL